MKFSVGLAKDTIPIHKHKNCEIVAYTKGSGTIYFGEKEITVRSGQILLIPPETLHSSTKITAEFERIYFNGEFGHILPIHSPTVIPKKFEAEGLTLAKLIYDNRYSKAEYLASLVNALIHFLAQTVEFEDDVFLAVKSIADAIGTNFYDCNLDIHALLQKSGYSVDYIRAHFKRITGKTPTDFLTSVRIDHACYLMELYKNTSTLADVAEKCGYSDYIYFSRRFKQKMGVSPKQYMAQL